LQAAPRAVSAASDAVSLMGALKVQDERRQRRARAHEGVRMPMITPTSQLMAMRGQPPHRVCLELSTEASAEDTAPRSTPSNKRDATQLHTFVPLG